MAYVTAAELTASFGQDELDEISSDRINLALANADEVVNAKLALNKLYTLPLSPVPTLIKMIAIAIARYEYYGGERVYNDKPNSDIFQRYTNSLNILDEIASGKMLVGDPVILQKSTSFTPRITSEKTRGFY